MSDATQRPLPPGRYRHFKGMEYELLGTATHSETQEELVVYRALYGGYGLFVRPRAMFAEDVTRNGIAQPRFAWLAPSTVRKLSHEAQLYARAFMLSEARTLEAAHYLHDFEGAPAEDVFAALAAYQNSDGGFGHGLEPDLNTPNSSALATTSALQRLHELGADAANPLVQGAMRWLNRAFDAELARWPLIPPTANDAPHAPWWTIGPDHPTWFRQYTVNPRAEVLAWLYTWPSLADSALVAQVEPTLTAHYAQMVEPLDMNELLCTLRLLDAPAVDDALRAAAHAAVVRSLPITMAQDAEAWESYSLQPLQVAPKPGTLFAAELASLVAVNLDHRIVEQNDDGSWSPQWSWGELHVEAWPAARRAWQGILTLEALRSLRAYGRMAL